LSIQFQNKKQKHCWDSSKTYRQCFCLLFWNCIDNAFVFCFRTVSTMLLFFVLELYRQCCCFWFWNCIDNAAHFPCFVQALQLKVVGKTSVMDPNLPS
jgi:hypothetical protein